MIMKIIAIVGLVAFWCLFWLFVGLIFNTYTDTKIWEPLLVTTVSVVIATTMFGICVGIVACTRILF